MSDPSSSVCVLDVDPACAAAIPGHDHVQARRALMVPAAVLPSGTLDLCRLAERHGEGALLLVLSGALARDVRILDRTTTELFGPGDIVVVSTPDREALCTRVTFHAERPTRVALLDGRFHAAARRWPELTGIVQARLAASSRRLAIQAAILALPRVESRVLAILWHLAERFGSAAPSGMLVALPLTHERLGRLVGAQRPTVTLALRRLADAGDVRRVADGWLVSSGSLDLVAAAGRASLDGRTAEVVAVDGAAVAGRTAAAAAAA